MTTLIAFGSRTQRYYTISATASTTDGAVWSMGPAPFQDLGAAMTCAVNQLGDTYVAFSNFGQASVSTNLVDWAGYDVEIKHWLITRVIWSNDRFLAVGMEKNPITRGETATIWVSGNGLVATWARIWITLHPTSILFDVTSLGSSNLLAVGATNDLQQPLILWSQDWGSTWTPVEPTEQMNGPVHSVAHDPVTDRVWLGGRGWVATGVWNNDSTVWTVNQGLGVKPITTLAYARDVLVALGGNTAWVSEGGSDWSSATAPGYQLLSAVRCFDQWWIGASSLLNQHTGFVLDLTSGVELVGFNNGVAAHSWLVV